MKKQFLLLTGSLFTASTLLAQGQIANNSFDAWATNNYNPTNWSTAASGANDAGGIYASFAATLAPAATKELTEVTNGTASIKLTSITSTLPVGPPVIPGVVGLGSLNTSAVTSGGSVFFNGSTFPYKPDTIFFDYKYTPAGTDTGALILQFNGGGADVAGGTHKRDLFATNSNWATDTFVLTSLWTGTPDNAIFQFSSSQQGAQVGSVLYVDNLRFGYTTPPVAVPVVSLAFSADTVTEGGSVTFTATLDVAAPAAFSVPVVYGGTATSADYTAATSFDFNLGELSKTITISTAVDSDSTDETVTATISNPNDNSYIVDNFANSKTLVIRDTTTTAGGTVGINNTLVLKVIRVYPNPASTNVNVVVPSEVAAQNVTITDISGKVVLSENNISGTKAINVANLANGNYVVTFTDAATKAFTGAKQLQVTK